MSVLKYRDPETGEYKITRTVKVVGEVAQRSSLWQAAIPITSRPK